MSWSRSILAGALAVSLVVLMMPPLAIAGKSCEGQCQSDYEDAAAACGKMEDQKQRRACQDSAYRSYKSCREGCARNSGECEDRCDEEAERCEEKCRKIKDKDERRRCWEACNEENGKCRKKCKEKK
jgi:hypothetical protein